MLCVILSRQYVNGNSNKMNLHSAKCAALEASFYKLLWLKDPQSGNDDMTNPDVHMSFVHARLELCFWNCTRNLLGKRVWCTFYLNHAQNIQF